MAFRSDVNNWEGEYPHFPELMFGSWTTWLVLYTIHRKMYKIEADIIPNFNLVIVHYFAVCSYFIDLYFHNSSIGWVIFIAYVAFVLCLYGQFLVKPIYLYPHSQHAMPYCMRNNRCLMILGIVFCSIIYCGSFLLFEGLASLVTDGTFLGLGSFSPLLPDVFVFLCSICAWTVILIKWRRNELLDSFIAAQTTFILYADSPTNKLGKRGVDYVSMDSDSEDGPNISTL